MVEVLTRETNELRQRHAPPPRQTSVADQMLALENEMERVRGECRRLVEQNEDLHAQLLHDSVEKGRSLLADRPPSLADELNGTRDSKQLLNALKEQEVCNQKLRAYINGILIRVIERHPEILEIRPGESAPPPPPPGNNNS
jgi:Rab11 family-interacting protein 3/4